MYLPLTCIAALLYSCLGRWQANLPVSPFSV